MEQNMQMYKAKFIDGKLMLTSSDIQVGDKVRSFNYPEQEEREVVNLRTSKKLVGAEDHSEIYHLVDIQYPNEVNTSAVTGFFKVIGEISPNATWVKQGDTFTEDEIAFHPTKGFWMFIPFSEDKVATETFLKSDLLEKGIWVVGIKGPCGHFH